MTRWEETQPSNESQQRLEEAENIVSRLVRVLPPCRAHTDLVSLLRRFADVRVEWQAERGAKPAA
jgi:hypothetical protein